MHRYIILDDVYYDHEIYLYVGSDIIDFDKDTNEIIITIDQLNDLLRKIISHERNQKEGD